MIDTNEIKQINQAIRDRRIPHGNFQKAFERIKELYELKDFAMPGSGLIVYGKSGVGKTTLTEVAMTYGIKNFGEDSVVRTQLTSGATVKGMLAEILYAFGDPESKKSSTKELQIRLANTIKERDCRLIIIDEVQHLIPGGVASKRIVDNILNAFKILDDTGVSFVLAGMDDLMLLWNADAQIRSRFQSTYLLDRFHYPQDSKSWRAIVKKYEETFSQFGISIDCEDFAERCFAATNGCMRPLVLILTTALVLAAKSDSRVITTEHLREAASKQVDKQDGLPNAFDASLESIQYFSRYNQTTKQLAPVHRGMSEIFST